MQSQEMRSTYNLRSNEFHSLAVGFSFSENNIFSSLVILNRGNAFFLYRWEERKK